MDIEVFLKINGFIGERGQVMEWAHTYLNHNWNDLRWVP